MPPVVSTNAASPASSSIAAAIERQLVRHDPPRDVVAVRAEQRLERVAARVVGRRRARRGRNGQHGSIHSFTFSRSSTEKLIALSTAFAMS